MCPVFAGSRLTGSRSLRLAWVAVGLLPGECAGLAEFRSAGVLGSQHGLLSEFTVGELDLSLRSSRQVESQLVHITLH